MNKQKKRWYDYLWIASLTYLILGFFNILFAWLGLICFLVPLIISIAKGTKGYCNRYCGRGQLSDFLLCNVFPDALEYIFGVCRSTGFKTGRNASLDIEAAMEMGIPRNAVPSGRCPVCIWVLQCDADIYRAWPDHNGAVQAEKLVCLLPNGYDDTADLQGKGQKERIKQSPSVTYIPVATFVLSNYSLSSRSFSSSIMVTTPRDSLTMPSLWKYRSIRVMTSR